MAEIARGMPADQYHAIKALSAGMAITIVEECPLRAWLDSSFNPNLVREHKQVFDVGTAAHLAVLEPAELIERVAIIPTEALDKKGGYSTKAAKDLRDAAYVAGKTPLKPAEWGIVAGIMDALEPKSSAGRLFTGGDAEVSLTWEWDGVPCKCRPDYLPTDGRHIVDLKTADSANPRAVARKAFTESWHVRAAWYLAGAAEVLGKRPAHYWFVVVEKDPPHIVEVYELDPRAIAWGERIIGRALGWFAECMKANRWPSYCGKPTVLELPGWAEFQLADREQAGEFSREKADIAVRMMAP